MESPRYSFFARFFASPPTHPNPLLHPLWYLHKNKCQDTLSWFQSEVSLQEGGGTEYEIYGYEVTMVIILPI